MKTNKMSKKNIVLAVLSGLLLLAGWILVFLVRWVFETWNGLQIEEMIFQLKAPLEGTGDGIILKGVLSSLLPALVLTGLACLIFIHAARKGKGGKVLLWSLVLGIILITGSAGYAWNRLELGEYVKNQLDDSSFIEDNYADPAKVNIEFPEKKRNLIYIFMESIESTYADSASGGAFSYNNIPELTELSREGENFSGDEGLLNGGRVMPATTFTMGGIFAQSAGLPLKVDLGEKFYDARGSFNKMNTQDTFFKKVTSLGDILEDAGYKNVFMLGSNATFGGRRLYFGQHGNYEIDDYKWAIEQGIIPENYYVFWGMEDRRLFAAAKDRLTELAKEDQPFNLNLLTVDTHFEDGYKCDLCREDYPDNDYANAIACSSRQVSEFVRWVQKQDFYENTTIVLCGDHLTMDSDFCKEVPADYNRKVYTIFLNADAQPEDPGRTRLYSTLDQFPTTLAALGCRIEGNRLGLGTNLYSSQDTLLERYGETEVVAQMQKKSNFMNELADINIYDEELLQAQGLLPKSRITMKKIDYSEGTISFAVSKIDNIHEDYKGVELRIDDGSSIVKLKMKEDENAEGVYLAKADLDSFNYRDAKATAVVIGQSGREYNTATMTGDLSIKQTEICAYLDALSHNPQYTIFIALRDDGSHSLNDDICEGLWKLGLKEDLRGHYRWSYYAVIEPDNVIEEMSEKELTRTGTLSDGAQYSVISQGGLSGAGGGAGRYLTCSVKINGIDYAVKRIGLNFVVYDAQNSRVVDSCEFNTYMGLDPKRIDVQELIDRAEDAEDQMDVN